jgi:hypothetical protein
MSPVYMAVSSGWSAASQFPALARTDADCRPQPDGTLVKGLARASRWQELLDDGVYTSVSEIAEAERVGKSYVRCSSLIAAPDARPFGGDACSCRLCGSLRGRHRFEPPHHGVQNVGAPM